MMSRVVSISLIAGLLCFAFLSAFFHISDVDVGFHIRTGAQVLESGGIPATNSFSHSCPDAPWLLHQWWPGVVFAVVFETFGVPGIILFKALLAAAIMGTVFCAARREARGGITIPLWVTTVGICVACVRFFPRPYLFSAMLFALMILFDRRWGVRKLWQWGGVPLLLALWSNTHAGVMYGFLYLCLQVAVACVEAAVAFRREHRLNLASVIIRAGGVTAGLALSAITLHVISPHGVKVLLLPVIYFRDPFWQSLIAEFRGLAWSTDWRILSAMAALLALQLVSSFAFLIRRTGILPVHGRTIPLTNRQDARPMRELPRLSLAVPAWVLALMTFRSQRCVLFFVIAAVPFAADMAALLLARWQARWRAASYGALVASWIAVTAFVFVPDPTYHFGVGLYPRLHPVHIYTFMREEVAPQNVFNEMRYGAGMLWWLYPDFRPFIDGRCEAYPKAFWRDVYQPAAAAEPEWRDVFASYDVTGALVHIGRGGDLRLAQTLYRDADWALVAFDDDTALFLKRTAANAAVVATHEYRLLWPVGATFQWEGELADTALAEARRALSLYPDNVYAGLALARTSLVAGKYEDAAAAYERLLDMRHMRFGDAIRRDYEFALSQLRQ